MMFVSCLACQKVSIRSCESFVRLASNGKALPIDLDCVYLTGNEFRVLAYKKIFEGSKVIWGFSRLRITSAYS